MASGHRRRSRYHRQHHADHCHQSQHYVVLSALNSCGVTNDISVGLRSTLFKKGVRDKRNTRIAGLSRVTVRRWIQSKAFPEISTKPPKPGLLDPWHEWLERQHINGNHNARQLWREMVDASFAGSETTFRDAVAKWRKQANAVVVDPARLPSASRVSRWLMLWRMIRGEENYASRFIESMCQKEPQLKMAQQLSFDFYRMLKTKNKSQLN